MLLICTEDIDFNLIETKEELKEIISFLLKENIVAVDTESYADPTYGDLGSALDPHTSILRLIQFNWLSNSVPVVLDLLRFSIEDIRDCLIEFFTSDVEKVAHNAVFEILVIRKLLGVKPRNFYCSMVDMQLIGVAVGSKSAKMRGYSYAALCRDFLGVFVDKTEQTSYWGAKELTTSQLAYAALDVGAPKSSSYSSLLLEAYLMLKEAIESSTDQSGYDMRDTRKLDQEAMAVVADIEFTGNPVNMEVFNSMYESLQREVEVLKLKLCKELGFSVDPKIVLVKGKPTRVYEVSEAVSKLLNNAKGLVKHVASVIKSSGGELEDLKAETLADIIYNLENDIEAEEDLEAKEASLREIDVINTLLDYKGVVKMLGTDYRDIVNAATGCIHGQYRTIGTGTGRMSSSGRIKTLKGYASLNMQQISNKKIPISIDSEMLFSSKSLIV
jgi:DNA polymerase I-like protein with 3'-5' exonuclease and polymerase domains